MTPEIRTRLSQRASEIETHTAKYPGKFNEAIQHAADLRAVLRALDWRPMAEAVKDGRRLLLRFKDTIPHAGEGFEGLVFIGRNTLGADGFDFGWQFAAPVGMGGLPDEWLAGWIHVPGDDA